jgi:hypothetical protein
MPGVVEDYMRQYRERYYNTYESLQAQFLRQTAAYDWRETPSMEDQKAAVRIIARETRREVAGHEYPDYRTPEVKAHFDAVREWQRDRMESLREQESERIAVRMRMRL